MTSPSPNPETLIVYDGECPYCRNYVRLVKMRESIGPVRLIDARKGGPEVDAIKAKGFDLDQGMIFYHGGHYYHGDEAIHMMGVYSGCGPLNALNRLIFRSPARAKALYPWLRAGRNMTLRILGKRKISGEKF